MAHFVRLKAAARGRWLALEVPTAAQWTLLDQQLQKAVNSAGGTYAPSGVINLYGAGLALATPYAFTTPLSQIVTLSALCGGGDRAMPQLYGVQNGVTGGGVQWTGTAPTSNLLTVQVTTTGTPGVADGRFKWSTDGGLTYTSNVVLAATVSIGGGTVVEFPVVRSYTLGELYTAAPVQAYAADLIGGFPCVQSRRPGAEYRVPLNRSLRNGATLDSVELFFSVREAHAAVPAVLPSFKIIRTTHLPTPGNPYGEAQVLHAGSPYAVAAPVNGAAWYAAGAVQSCNRVCTTNNVIDKSVYSYEAVFIDESGANKFTYPPYSATFPFADNIAYGTALYTLNITMSAIGSEGFA